MNIENKCFFSGGRCIRLRYATPPCSQCSSYKPWMLENYTQILQGGYNRLRRIHKKKMNRIKLQEESVKSRSLNQGDCRYHNSGKVALPTCTKKEEK